MFNATYKVLENLSTEGNYRQRRDADFALNSLMYFDFIFILHLMKDIMEIVGSVFLSLTTKISTYYKFHGSCFK